MMPVHTLWYTVLVLSLVACASPRDPRLESREAWLASASRTYAGVSKDDVLRAAQELFRLADGDDFTFAHEPEVLQATRQWMTYLVIMAGFGSDHWTVRARNVGGGRVEASVTAHQQSQSASITQISLSGGTPSLSPTFGTLISDPVLYSIFWLRMDYLLGLRPDWLTCKDAETLFPASSGKWLLCNSFNIKDDRPAAPLLLARTQPTSGVVAAEPAADMASSPAMSSATRALPGVHFPHGQEPQKAAAAALGSMAFEVEKIAKAEGCLIQQGAELLTEPGPVETYRVRCGGGSEMIVKCELRNCRLLR